jgi:16S rRNA (cytosine1402-N4)-methyltransferase
MTYHEPVMVAEVIAYMRLQPGNTYVDCTAGGGGHLLAMIKASPDSRFIGLDWDQDALDHARSLLSGHGGSCTLCEGNFRDVGLILSNLHIERVHGFLFDYGVSLHQVSTPSRGFSYDHDGPLLMRMSSTIPTLREKLRSTTEQELIHVLHEYGDVRQYRRIAKILYIHRKTLQTTGALRAIVEQVTPPRYRKKNCRRVFQALRIWVNDELGNLIIGLEAAFEHLHTGGRLVTIAYHSGEDRIIKRFMREQKMCKKAALLTKKVVKPSQDEIHANPRARSARLRASEKCA